MKVIGLAGWSGAGKTTLLTRAIPQLQKQGLRVSVIKHAHHAFDVDVPGKDSWKHREAGAAEVFALIRAGVLRFEQVETLPLNEVVAAHRRIESRSAAGPVVLVADAP